MPRTAGRWLTMKAKSHQLADHQNPSSRFVCSVLWRSGCTNMDQWRLDALLCPSLTASHAQKMVVWRRKRAWSLEVDSREPAGLSGRTSKAQRACSGATWRDRVGDGAGAVRGNTHCRTFSAKRAAHCMHNAHCKQ